MSNCTYCIEWNLLVYMLLFFDFVRIFFSHWKNLVMYSFMYHNLLIFLFYLHCYNAQRLLVVIFLVPPFLDNSYCVWITFRVTKSKTLSKLSKITNTTGKLQSVKNWGFKLFIVYLGLNEPQSSTKEPKRALKCQYQFHSK